jgi:hypothetical protein
MDLSYQPGGLKGNRIMPLSEIVAVKLDKAPEDV